MAGQNSCPITKFILAFCLLMSLVFRLTSWDENVLASDRKENSTATILALRYFSSFVTYTDGGIALVSSIVMLKLGFIFERQLGPKKFEGLFILNWIVSAFTNFGIETFDPSFESTFGPLPFIFSLLLFYYACVPVTRPNIVQILSINFSEKAWIYALCLQLSLSKGKSSLLPSFMGLLFGALYLKNFLMFQKFHSPRFFRLIFRALNFRSFSLEMFRTVQRRRREDDEYSEDGRSGIPLLPINRFDAAGARIRTQRLPHE